MVAFSILLSLVIGLPYLEAQAKTNASVNTKLAILVLLENGQKLGKITQIQPEVTFSGGSLDLKMLVHTKGVLDGNIVSTPSCFEVCDQIDPTDFYGTVTLDWTHTPTGLGTPGVVIYDPCDPNNLGILLSCT